VYQRGAVPQNVRVVEAFQQAHLGHIGLVVEGLHGDGGLASVDLFRTPDRAVSAPANALA
jgi:hypothetical protein